jgi:hypothetical protein
MILQKVKLSKPNVLQGVEKVQLLPVTEARPRFATSHQHAALAVAFVKREDDASRGDHAAVQLLQLAALVIVRRALGRRTDAPRGFVECAGDPRDALLAVRRVERRVERIEVLRDREQCVVHGHDHPLVVQSVSLLVPVVSSRCLVPSGVSM